ncbi:MAG: polysaccharide biosynthesis protein [Bacteroidales bacterium]|nr:polysaccharide biosynthesis protein [Bacteroidales bacterium]
MSKNPPRIVHRIIAFFKDTYLRGELIFAIDILLSLLASLVAIFGVKALAGTAFYSTRLLTVYLTVAVVVSVALFLLLRTFRIIIRHLGPKDVERFAGVVLGKGIVVLLALVVFGRYSKWALLIVVLDMLLTMVFLLGIRFAMILAYGRLNKRILDLYNKEPILVYDTTNKSVATLTRLRNSTHYEVVGFLTPYKAEDRLIIEGLPVYSFEKREQFERIVSRYGVKAILFARDSDARQEIDRLLPYCSSHDIKTLIVPDVDEVVEGEPLIHPRPIKIEDLLGRQEIVISLDEIKSFFKDKVVMVTGAAGSIGSELVRQLAGFGIKKLVLYDNGETAMHNLRLELEDKYKDLDFVPVIGDVRHPERLDFAFRTWHPQIVFHAAAYKHVPLMEENPCEAVLVNVYGTQNVADKCVEYGVEKMVMISTDKAVNPTNIMGCTKRLAEIYVQSLGLAIENGEKEGKTKFVTTRFGNVLGSNGSVIPRFREQIAKGGPVTVTHPEINRFFMTIPEACRLVMEAATMSTGNQIFVFDMGEPVKIDQLARRMITLAGFTPDKDIKIEYTGLRPGEKLYEEVLATEENTLPAFHERIRIAKVRKHERADVERDTLRLERLARDVNIPDMVRLMKQIVPEFISQNSRYQELDKELRQ